MVGADGPQEGQKWNPEQTPQLVEIMDHLAPESPVNEVVLRKSAQVGATTLGIAWSSYVGVVDPAPMMIVMPTLDSADGFNREKLNPAFDASPAVARCVRAAGSRSARASTARTKRFPGGSVILDRKRVVEGKGGERGVSRTRKTTRESRERRAAIY